jgi:cell division protein FtsI (penicillin-binding protein 3)
MADFTRDQISFGQGLSVTAIQQAAAVAGIVNGGVYHSPTIIKSARNGQGEPVKVPASTTRRVISAKASAQVRDMMEAVVTLAPDRAVPGYRTIGKTGTAQRIDPSCHCYRGYTASYVGVGPAENPSILAYVVLNNPVKGHEGSAVALPVARQILSVALPRYGVEPSTSKPPKAVLEYKP